MKKLTLQFTLVLVLVGLVGVLGLGCGKKAKQPAPGAESNADTNAAAAAQPAAAGAEPASVSASKLQGSQQVMAALDQKDYDGAVATLLQIKQKVTTSEQQIEFATLAAEVRTRMLEAGPSDPKIAKALSALRFVTGGR